MASDLGSSDMTRGCLSTIDGKSPRFHLSDDQRKAIRAALARPADPMSDKALLATTLTAFNCIACHIRDDFGGVLTERNPHFQMSAKNLGDDGRMPPPLTLVGAKLQTVWMKKVLFDGESVRPYMFTRMPQYGEPNLRHLPDLLARMDKVESHEFSLPNSESEREKERTSQCASRRRARTPGKSKPGLHCLSYSQWKNTQSKWYGQWYGVDDFLPETEAKLVLSFLAGPERVQTANCDADCLAWW